MDLKVEFGKVLRERRLSVNLSQEQLAFNADIDRTYISKLERGINQPSLVTLFTLAKELKCKPSALLLTLEKAVD